MHFDAAVIRGAGAVAGQLAAAAASGIDVLIDTVGGEQLQAAVNAAREGARLLVVGALSGQLASSGTGRVAPVELDSFQLLRKITMRGYSADEDPDARAEWVDRSPERFQSGRLRFPHVLVEGIARGPEALQHVAEGRYFGMTVVEL